MTQHNTAHNKPSIIGIFGDGQLALMLAESLTKKATPFLALLQSDNSPMERIFPASVTRDPERFVNDCDVFTLENEFLKVEELSRLLGKKSDKLFPEIKSYKHFGDKISQRNLYQELGLPSPRWMTVTNATELQNASQKFPFPFIAKASSGGYDGKGVRVIKSSQELNQVSIDFGLPLLLEEKVSLKTEVARGFVRTKDGDISFLPLVETLQQDGICHLVQYPARVSEKVKAEVENALKKLSDYPLIGIFNFEFFVDENDHVTINEGAPRPHNSQHLTIDASNVSQFELLALALGNQPLPQITTKPSLMVNILGQTQGNDIPLTLPDLPTSVKVTPKLYGKEKCAPGRKMGHVNLVDEAGTHDLKSLGEKILREYRL
ncbi:MAG: ATP-grasp domain-containing protein [Bdellovibrionota bacterium]